MRDVIKCCDRCEKDFHGISLPALIPSKVCSYLPIACASRYFFLSFLLVFILIILVKRDYFHAYSGYLLLFYS